ncbi:MAG TPA: hypothetical protein VH601_18370 [Bryobacteraceae bacterium]
MTPLEEYAARRNRWQHEHDFLQKRFIAIGNWRLAVGITAAALAWLAFASRVISPWWLALAVIAFIGLVAWHSRVIRARTVAERALRYYDHAVARVNDDWAGKGATGEDLRDPAHIYADDLDVFGRGSLFELISTARTAAGEQTLASWLLAPAAREIVLERQSAISELRPRLDFREDLALMGEDVRSQIKAAALAHWGSAVPAGFSTLLRLLAVALAFAGLLTLAAFFAQIWPIYPLAAVIGCNLLFLYATRKRVAHVIGAVETPGQDLLLLSLILGRLERESFESPLLRNLRSALDVAGLPASRRIMRLKRWIELLDSGDHMLLRVLRPVIMSREQAAMAVEVWRRESGPHIGRWIRAVAEFEALSSFATLAFERPDWTFPTLLTQQTACFDAEGLRHPLLPTARCVPNGLAVGGEVQLLIISGSNMSGKSTLLRAAGLNAVLAWAGAPVSAAALRISPLQVAASMRVVDSLQDNRSRFFTEITRLREIVDRTRTGTAVFFLLDELLSGTNSHDRAIGAAGIARALVQSGAIGLITTHDLALARMEQDLGPGVRNVHFEDQIANGEIHFDYKLRPGVVTRSNALELMRVVGLSV